MIFKCESLTSPIMQLLWDMESIWPVLAFKCVICLNLRTRLWRNAGPCNCDHYYRARVLVFTWQGVTHSDCIWRYNVTLTCLQMMLGDKQKDFHSDYYYPIKSVVVSQYYPILLDDLQSSTYIYTDHAFLLESITSFFSAFKIIIMAQSSGKIKLPEHYWKWNCSECALIVQCAKWQLLLTFGQVRWPGPPEHICMIRVTLLRKTKCEIRHHQQSRKKHVFIKPIRLKCYVLKGQCTRGES